MSVGVPELDADHKGLIEVINQLAANVKDPNRGDVVRQCLFSLLRYAETHFKREERVMIACDFPGLEHHKGEHQDFADEIRSLACRFDNEPDETVIIVKEQLLNFLQDWFYHHVLIEDMAYRPYAKRKAAREAAKSFRAAEIWWKR